MGFELTPERAQGVADTLTPKQMARAIRRFDRLMRNGVGRDEVVQRLPVRSPAALRPRGTEGD